MVALLQMYSLEQIIIFIVMLSLAVKGCINFLDWLSVRLKVHVENIQKPERLEEHLEIHSQAIEDIQNAIKNLQHTMNILIESDRDAIKTFITRQHHYFSYQKKWIDDYSLNCIEKRYEHYKDQGGNSFIGTFMEELRALPRKPPNENE